MPIPASDPRARPGAQANEGKPIFLTQQDLAELTAWRRKLHAAPELSGEEAQTAREVRAFLSRANPDHLIPGLGGHGVAALYEGAEPGPTVMLRAELDALPIAEHSAAPHRSARPGKAHLCGHDGHMASLAGLAIGLGRRRPRRGRAALLFQPAEETGAGAAAVIADPKFREIAPDLAFAYHNMPGVPLGSAELAEGPVACASRGMRVALSGRATHASTPEFGLSPMAAVSALMPALTHLGGGAPQQENFARVTVTHATMGAPAFGVAPGRAEIWATLRALTDARMATLGEEAEALVRRAAREAGLSVDIAYEDVFEACWNAPEAVALLARALEVEGVPHARGGLPMRASEDFGRFGRSAKVALVMLGAGESHPGLHDPAYDFPDALIGIGARVFMRVVTEALG